ncbi:hypothetical protein AAG906_027963 [Vitis piasezkii]
MEEIKGKKKDISEGKEDHDSTVNANPEKVLIKEEMTRKHTPPTFPQALHGKKWIRNVSEILEVVEKALLDLGASVNLLPYSVYKQLGVGELKPTSITLSLADRSVKIPRGIIEVVLVQVDNFYYPVDFVVLDADPIVKEANYVPIILGRPFLATSNAIINSTSNAIINFRNGLIQLTFGNMTLELNIFYMSKKQITPKKRKLNEILGDLEEGLPELSDLLTTLQGWRRIEEILPLFNKEELNLKPLPTELKYTYLEENKNPWVSPTQVVPKKSGITMVQNEKGEEIATRLTSSWMVVGESLRPSFLLFLGRLLRVFSNRNRYECLLVYVMHLQHSDDECLVNLEAVLNRCIEKDLVLNREKCHFMVQQGIVLGHIISKKDIEVDKAKVELIIRLPPPTTIKGVRQFLGYAGDFATGVVLGQREDGKPYVIYYASKTLNEAQRNYTTIEKELLVVVFALDKFRAYLQDAKARLIRWILLLQEFNLQIKDKKGVENVVANHLSRLAIAHNSNESLMLLENAPWYAHIANYLVLGEVPNYVFKWVEAIPCKHSDRRVVLKFLKENIFSRFGVPKAIISDGGTHFCNKLFETLLTKYGVKHKVATPYHPQTSGQVELANREIKNMLMKAWWAIKKVNMDLTRAGMKRCLDLNGIEELRNDAYINSKVAKQRMKRWHDQLISNKEFLKGQRVLLYDSRLHIFPRKLKLKWIGPFIIHQVHLNGVVELLNSNNTDTFKVNGHRLKPFMESFNQDNEEVNHLEPHKS